MHKILLDFEIQIDHPIPVGIPGLLLNDKKKKTNHQVDFVVPADHRVNVKESES